MQKNTFFWISVTLAAILVAIFLLVFVFYNLMPQDGLGLG